MSEPSGGVTRESTPAEVAALEARIEAAILATVALSAPVLARGDIAEGPGRIFVTIHQGSFLFNFERGEVIAWSQEAWIPTGAVEARALLTSPAAHSGAVFAGVCRAAVTRRPSLFGTSSAGALHCERSFWLRKVLG